VTFEGHFGYLLTVVTSCAQLTSSLLAIAKFLVLKEAAERVSLTSACDRFHAPSGAADLNDEVAFVGRSQRRQRSTSGHKTTRMQPATY